MELNYIILSIIQAVTELFPVSSSGHLLIFSEILTAEIDQTFITYLHFWTALGLIIFYREKIIELIKGVWAEIITFKDKDKQISRKSQSNRLNLENKQLILAIVIATVPTAILGYFLDDLAENLFYNRTSIAISLFSIGLVMVLINFLGKSKKQSQKTLLKYIIVGIVQILAIIPGVSRSGSCLIAGKLLNIKYPQALRLTFLLGIPMTLGPFTLNLLTDSVVFRKFFSLEFVFYGVITVLVELLCLSFLKRFKSYKNLTYFGVYRVIIGIVFILT